MATTTVASLSTSLPTPPILNLAHAPALELRQPAAAHDDPLTLTNTVFSQTGIASFSNPLTYTSAGKPTLTTSTSVPISSNSSSTSTSGTTSKSGPQSSETKSSSSSSSSSPGTATATPASTSATTTPGSSNAALAPSIGAGKAVALVCALAGLVACGF